MSSRNTFDLNLGLVTATLVLTGFIAGGCVSTTVITTNSVSAQVAEEELPEEQLLNVGITVFDDGLASSAPDLRTGAVAGEGEQDQQGEAAAPAAPTSSLGVSDDPLISPQVRSAESRFIPFRLRSTLQNTGYWGAVRVIPGPSNSVDLTVSGTIVHSDGERLVVQVKAVDATGRVWLDREYDRVIGLLAYRESLTYRDNEPFQDLYDSIANDLAAALEAVPAKERVAIRQVAELRFANDLAPEAFSGYLADGTDGRYEIRRLPARSDPMVTRMRRIREREYLFFDTLDDYYETFADRMEIPYSEWRKYSYEEVVALRERKQQALFNTLVGAGMIAGGLLSNSDSTFGRVAEWVAIGEGINVLRTGMDQRRQSRLHLATLEELNGSFETELEPVVMEIEGQTVTLQGSLNNQFDEWRGILRDIYALETGTVVSAGQGADGVTVSGEPNGT
jgi:hypothetical protein